MLKKLIIIVLGIVAILTILFLVAPYLRSYTPEELSLKTELEQVNLLFDKEKMLNEEVSKAPIGWHLYHICKTINVIGDSLLVNANKGTYSSDFNAVRNMIFATENIPRGAAQSPDSVRPPESYTKEQFLEELSKAKESILKIQELPENAYFNHFAFGNLNRDMTLQFLMIHTRHHLKIADDILNK